MCVGFILRVVEVVQDLDGSMGGLHTFLYIKVSTGILVGKQNNSNTVLTLLTNKRYEKNYFTKINAPAMRPRSGKY